MKLSSLLFQGCKSNSRKAQSEVYKLFYNESFKIAMRYTKSSDQAKEVMNSSFLKAFVNIKDFKGDEQNFFGWVKRIIINQALDQLRAASKFETNTELNDISYQLTTTSDTQLEYEDIIRMIQLLPSRTSAVFNLFAIEGYSHKEIAEMLNLTETNSKYYLSVARKTLQSWLFKTERYEQ
jgi:RNA polymerase sigma-70 factor (ECF subfamily)